MATPTTEWAKKNALHMLKQYTGQAPKDHLPPKPKYALSAMDAQQFNVYAKAITHLPPKIGSDQPGQAVSLVPLEPFAYGTIAETPEPPADYWSKRLPKTQKARGVLYGRLIGHNKWGVSANGPLAAESIRVFPSKDFKMPDKWPMFARPCPIRPRHGFVESRKVHSAAEAVKVLNETLLVEREAEMILMPALSGRYSAVATNAGVVWGHGNDGATSRAGGLLIPAASSAPEWSNTILQQYINASDYQRAEELARGLISDTAYLEIVEDDQHTYIVQVRDGPAQQATRNYIPMPTRAGIILTPDNGYDLLAWERKIKDYAGNPEVVVSLPGHTLSDHFAVHAIAAGMPVITDREVRLNETIKPETERVPWTGPDYDALAERVLTWLEADYFPRYNADRAYSKTRNRLMTAVGTMHAMGTWEPRPHLMNMMANAVISLLRASAAASVGEMRHWFGNGPQSSGDEEDADDIDELAPPPGDYPFKPEFWTGQPNGKKKSRDVFYSEFFEPWTLPDLIKLHTALVADFSIPGWDSSYGGKAWANVAQAGLDLAVRLHGFLNKPTAVRWGEVAAAANTFVHTSHNNGVALNKWLLGLDDFVKHPQLAWLNPYAAELVLNDGKEIA